MDGKETRQICQYLFPGVPEEIILPVKFVNIKIYLNKNTLANNLQKTFNNSRGVFLNKIS